MTRNGKGRCSSEPRVVVAADILAETICVWQPHSKQPLTREDAREIVENVSGFFRVLRDWAEEDRTNAALLTEIGDPSPTPPKRTVTKRRSTAGLNYPLARYDAD